MEKLIELLNEYEKQYINRPNYFRYKDKMLGKYIFCEIGGRNIDNQELMIISKRYGFIKWLVENDKIKPLGKFIGWETDEDEPYIQFDLSDQYIAYLSIQDSPLEFLIGILK